MLHCFSRPIIAIGLFLPVLTVNAQLTSANNGLTASGATVSLGGTLSNAQTAIDFGSSNSSSNFLIKKGVSNYFFLGNNGNTGIGTTSPAALLDVHGSFNVFGASTFGSVYPNAPNQHVFNYLGDTYAGRGIKLVNNYTGSVVALQSISNSLYLTTDAGAPSNIVIGSILSPFDATEFRVGYQRWEFRAGALSVNRDWTGEAQFEMTTAVASRKGMVVKAAASQTANLQEWQNSSGSILTVINSNGSVGIGTSTTGTNKLAVEGSIAARKVKVTQTAPWPDYVFEPDYRLPSLQEVEQFIQLNKHLPEINSAKEIEANGLDLGDNQGLLLKKIEELTLYMIQQEKNTKKLAEENQQLKKEILEIKTMLKK